MGYEKLIYLMKKKQKNNMKYLQCLFILFLMLFSSKEIVAQRDSLSLQRKARKAA